MASLFPPRIVGALAATVLLALPAGAEPFRLIVTDLETPLVPNSVMELAEREGYFDRAGVDVEFVRVQQTPMALAALQSGEGEMANVSVESLVQLALQGVDDLRAVASPNKALPYMILGQGVSSAADLSGKSFGIGRIGSLDHTLSMKVLAEKGVDPSKLNLVPLGQPNVRAQALMAGQVDATTMSIGTLVALPDGDKLNVLVGVDDYYNTAPVVSKVNAVTSKTLSERGDEVQAVIEAITLASRDFATDKAVWVDAMVKARPDVSRESLERLADAFAGSWSVNGGLQKAEIDYTLDWMWESDDFKGKPRPALEAWVDFAPEEAVLAKIGTVEGMDAPSQ